MSNTTYGTCSYKWDLTIDAELLCDYLIQKCGIHGEIDEYEVDGDEFIIHGSAECRASRYYDPGTYYDAPEEEYTYIGGNDSIKGLKEKVLEALREIPDKAVKVGMECFYDDGEYEED